MLIIDPVILPASNNHKSIPFEMLQDAFPEIRWAQPRNNKRGIVKTKKYMTPLFAEELSEWIGCPAENERLPQRPFIEDALRPPPIYFETEERTLQGVCCVCYKKGVLGRCPNPSCGLLMHYSCVPSLKPGEGQKCPICKNEKEIQEATELPYWHEAEVGAKLGRPKLRSSPEVGKMPFPTTRWPELQEARLYGYRSLEDWYVESRAGGLKEPKLILTLRVEFREEESQRRELQEEAQEEESPETPFGQRLITCRPKRPVDLVSAVPGPCYSLGSAKTGRTLVEPGVFDDVGPLVAKRMESALEVREELGKVLRAKWEEANRLPEECEMPETINGEDLRARLKIDQGRCLETREMISVQKKILGATAKNPHGRNPLKGLESATGDYRLSPVDQLLERKVLSSARAEMWVVVLPKGLAPGEKECISWRRWASCSAGANGYVLSWHRTF